MDQVEFVLPYNLQLVESSLGRLGGFGFRPAPSFAAAV